jgi:hypothetical protein
VIPFTGGASEPSNTLLPGKAGGTVAVRRTLVCTICRIVDPTQVPRPRQLRDASTVMRFRPAHQSMINRRFDDRASCPARKSPKRTLARKPRIHSPASGNGGHESGLNRTLGTRPRPSSQLAEERRGPARLQTFGTSREGGERTPRLTGVGPSRQIRRIFPYRTFLKVFNLPVKLHPMMFRPLEYR